MAEETTSEKSVAPKHLVALINDTNQKKTRIQSISGEIGERIKAAVENGHLNRKAFGLMCQLDKQDEMKRNDNIRAIRLYLDICEEQLWQGEEHVGDFADQAEQKAREEAAAHEAAGEANAEALKEGIKPIRTEQELAAERAETAAQKERDARSFAEGGFDLDLLRQRGRAAFEAGYPGIVPEDLAGSAGQDAWLDGWDKASVESAERKDAAAGTKRKRGAANAEAAGSYAVHH